jgi:Mce-associated membrane protein
VPPHRRRPAPSAGQAPPIRRPKVAGLRNRPEQRTDEAHDEPVEERGNGVLHGLLGTPPAQDAEETTVLPRVPEEIDPETNEPPPVTDDSEADSDADPEPVEAATKTVPKPRPEPTRPAGKRRATGTSRPTDLSAAESDAGAEPRRSRHAQDDERPTRTKAQTQISVAILLVVVAVVLAGLAVFFRGKANDLTSGDTNTALTDTATTSQLKGQLTTAIKETFSYNYTDLGSTEKAVKENLTGKALCEYNLLFGEVKKYAPEQKIVLDTTVRELAVVRIDGDRAEALVYIDQLSTRVDVNKTVAVGGQFAVQAHREGDHWKITEFDMFGQPLFNGKPAPTC